MVASRVLNENKYHVNGPTRKHVTIQFSLNLVRPWSKDILCLRVFTERKKSQTPRTVFSSRQTFPRVFRQNLRPRDGYRKAIGLDAPSVRFRIRQILVSIKSTNEVPAQAPSSMGMVPT
jgi:hypothetical protein